MRMRKHVTLLGALFIAYHVIGLTAGLCAVALFTTVGCLTQDPQLETALTIIGAGFGTFLLVLSIPGIIAGIGLLRCARWSRILALIIGALDLLHIPFGTALGVYCLWVLLQDETLKVFEAGRGTS